MSLYNYLIKVLLKADTIPAVLIRVFLAPVFIIAGYNKMQFSNDQLPLFEKIFADQSIIDWFGNHEWGLGLPFPEVLANLAAWTEFFGGWLLLIGLATRLVSLPLMFTMIIAATTVHLENGWYAVTPTNPATSSAIVGDWLGIDMASDSLKSSEQAKLRLDKIRDIVDEHGNPDWLYEKGNVVLLNNGIEFATTYFIMLLALFFIGPGKFLSIDYWLSLKNTKD